MTKSAKQITAKYDGTCSCCGRHVDAGEPITWLSKGIIECADCTPQTLQKATKSDAWEKAFTWDNHANQYTPKPDSQLFPVAKSTPKPEPKPEPTHTDPIDPFINQDAQAQTVIDLLVTLVNAANRLNTEQCETVRKFAFHQQHHSASSSRRQMFAHAAKALS